MSSYNYLLKRDLSWLENPPMSSTVPLTVIYSPSTNSHQVTLLSGDGFSVSLPLPLLLASSGLLQSTVSSHQCYGSSGISLPSVGGGTLVLVAEILRRGETSLLSGAQNSGERLKEVQGVMDMLQCGVSVALKQKNITRNCVKSDMKPKTVELETLKISNVTTINNWIEDCSKPSFSPSQLLKTPEKKTELSVHSSFTMSPTTTSPNQPIQVKEELDFSSTEPEDAPPNKSATIPSANTTTSKTVCCPICNKFIRNLSRHTKLVHPETIFTCPICEFRFCAKSNLEKHMLGKHKSSGELSLDEASYLCAICEERFLLASSLRMHVKIVHGGYNCNACPMKFPTEDSFKKHVEAAHIKMRYSCGQCKKLFVTKSFAERHCTKAGHSIEDIVKFKLKDRKPAKKVKEEKNRNPSKTVKKDGRSDKQIADVKPVQEVEEKKLLVTSNFT